MTPRPTIPSLPSVCRVPCRETWHASRSRHWCRDVAARSRCLLPRSESPGLLIVEDGINSGLLHQVLNACPAALSCGGAGFSNRNQGSGKTSLGRIPISCRSRSVPQSDRTAFRARAWADDRSAASAAAVVFAANSSAAGRASETTACRCSFRLSSKGEITATESCPTRLRHRYHHSLGADSFPSI